jgi:hypothetical protein
MTRDKRDPQAIGLILAAMREQQPNLTASERYDLYVVPTLVANYGESPQDFEIRAAATLSTNAV